MPRFMARRSTLASVSEGRRITEGGSELRSVHLVARSGLAVDVTIRRQLGDSARRLPLVVVLGGHLTGSDAARQVGETPGLVVAAMSYPFQGDPRPSATTFLMEIPKIRAAFLRYAARADARPGLPDDAARCGHGACRSGGWSLGAPFVTIAGALRSANPSRLGSARLGWVVCSARSQHAAHNRVCSAARARRLDRKRDHCGTTPRTENWVRQISPDPFVMVNPTTNGCHGRRSTRCSSRHPNQKEQVWMSGKPCMATSQPSRNGWWRS